MAVAASASTQAAILAVVCAVLLLLGFQTGRHAASTRKVAPDKKISQEDHLGNASLPPDFDPAKLTDAAVERVQAARAFLSSQSVAGLAAPGGLEAQQQAAKERHDSVLEALTALVSSFDREQHPRLVRALGLLKDVDEQVHTAMMALLPAAAERLGTHRVQEVDQSAERSSTHGSWMLSVTVQEKPFGMHVKRGTTTVEEVFPGFHAHRAGVRRGCELREVAGQKVEPGTWLEIFQQSAAPFPMKLSCGGAAPASSGSPGGPLDQDPRRYRVMVTKKPYGMNIQVYKRPRVVEVLPGYPAEAAGVQRGFVLTEVNEVPVDVDNWFEEYQAAQLPFTLTFDTKVPVPKGNPFFQEEEVTGTPEEESAGGAATTTATPSEEPLPGKGFTDFRCGVEKLPFGMQVRSPPHRRPRVASVLPGSPAARAGVRAGDVLVEVAGRAVTSRDWFASLQQAIPPFGLLFRRPVDNTTLPAGRHLASAGA